MSDFLNRMKAAAKTDKKTIVLVEGEDPRVVEAAKKISAEGLADIIMLGDPVPADLDIPGVTVIDPKTDPRHGAYAAKFAELRAKKGVTLEQAQAQMNDATYFGTMMVKMGDADGLVSGACHSTANTLRPALQILKTAPGTKLVSAFFVMCTDTPQFGTDGTLVFADCGLNINPTSDELSEIAIASAHSWEAFMGGAEPHVALLSYSTMGSAGGEVAKKVQEAVGFCKEKAPELAIDGDLQLDAAIVPTVAQLKAPGSPVAGKANVLVFPDLESGNIGYKLVQRFAGAEAYGPILQGIAKPVNDLSRGCYADDIVGVVAITAVQAPMAAKAAYAARAERRRRSPAGDRAPPPTGSASPARPPDAAGEALFTRSRAGGLPGVWGIEDEAYFASRSTSSAIMYSSSVGITITVTAESSAEMT